VKYTTFGGKIYDGESVIATSEIHNSAFVVRMLAAANNGASKITREEIALRFAVAMASSMLPMTQSSTDGVVKIRYQADQSIVDLAYNLADLFLERSREPS
jgi:hypothetical protein